MAPIPEVVYARAQTRVMGNLPSGISPRYAAGFFRRENPELLRAVEREISRHEDRGHPRRYISRTGKPEDSYTVINRGNMEISTGSFQRALRQFTRTDETGTLTHEIPIWDGPAEKFITVGSRMAAIEAKEEGHKAKQAAGRKVPEEAKVLAKPPKGTDLPEKGYIGTWGGFLASVYPPDPDYDFDPSRMAMKWTVFYVMDDAGNPAPLDMAEWMKGRQYTGIQGNEFMVNTPSSGKYRATFLNARHYWMKVDLRDLGKPASRLLVEHLKEVGLVDVSDYANDKADKLTKSDWTKVLRLGPTTATNDRDLQAVYDLFGDDWGKGNAVFEMMSKIPAQASWGAVHGMYGQYGTPGSVLRNLKGVYRTARNGKVQWILAADKVKSAKTRKGGTKAKAEEE